MTDPLRPPESAGVAPLKSGALLSCPMDCALLAQAASRRCRLAWISVALPASSRGSVDFMKAGPESAPGMLLGVDDRGHWSPAGNCRAV